MSDVWVYGEGPVPCSVMFVGERPGLEEFRSGRPFSEYGKSGKEIRRYLFNEGIRFEDCYVTNVCKDYLEGNPDPTPVEIERDSPLLIEELKSVKPKFIGAVGRFAAQELIGPEFAGMEVHHGLPFRTVHRTVMPLYHPSYGLHSPHVTPLVWDDFRSFGKLVRGEEVVEVPEDHLVADYQLLKDKLPRFLVDQPIYVDTEGSAVCPWGLSYTQEPGKGYVILAKNTALLKRFAAVIKKLDLEVVCHPVIHDMGVLRAMGVEFSKYRCTMTKAYLNTLVPQGLKPLSRRLCGMVQDDYEDIVREAQANKTLDWLMEAWQWANNRYPEESKTHSQPKTPKTATIRSRKTSHKNVRNSNELLDQSRSQL